MFSATLIIVIFQIAIVIMSVVIHEVSHGVAAYLQGDKTAQYAGRLTLNPLPHLDPFGSVLLPMLGLLPLLFGGGSPFIIGWAKPVPYNPYNLKNQKWGPAIVGLAGPGSNILVALVFTLIVQLGGTALPFGLIIASEFIVFINIWLALLNLVPFPPLDGSKLFHAFFPRQAYKFEAMFSGANIFLTLIIVWFVFLPIISRITSFVVNILLP